MPSELHERLIDYATRDGWRRGRWKEVLRKALRQTPWSSFTDDVADVFDFLSDINLNPDAFRIKVEGPGGADEWSYEVLVIEVLEVEVTGHFNQEKLHQYMSLWWRMDGTSRFHFRAFKMDRFGNTSDFVTTKTIYQMMEISK